MILRKAALASFTTIGILAPASLLLPTSCASNTGEKRFSFEARVGGATREASRQDADLTFVNERNWTITLTKADVTLGPIYLNVVAPLHDTTTSLLGLFVKNAWADGESHLDTGRVVGEVLGQVTFNTLSSELISFPVSGSLAQEQVRTAEIWFYPKPWTSTEAAALSVAGTASLGEKTVRFRGDLVLNEAWQPDVTAGARGTTSIAELRKIRGIPAPFYPTEGGHLEVRFDIEQLFRGADFSNLDDNPQDHDGTKVLVQSKSGAHTTDQVMTNLYQGLRSTSGTYSVSWVGP